MRSSVARVFALVALAGAAVSNPIPSLARAYDPYGYEALFSRVLAHPGDSAANKQLAREAEARGDLRHAFAALERVVLSSPGDTEAQAEFDRIRHKLMPAVTRVTVEAGANYASNPRQFAHSGSSLDFFDVTAPGLPISLRHQDDATFDGKVEIVDERSFGSQRWRSYVLAQGQIQADISALNSQTLAVESGPVFQVLPDVWLHVAGGAAIVWLDEKKLYDEASVSATVGGLYKGLTQTLTARYTWRDANLAVNTNWIDGDIVDPKADSAQIFDLEGRFVVSPRFTKADLFYFMPHLQVSRNDGDPTEFYGFGDTILQRPLFPGDYTQLGAALAYYFPLYKGKAFLGTGVEVYHRWYDESSSTIERVGICGAFCGELVSIDADKRRDTYIEPTAHLIFPNMFGPNVDLRFDYRFEYNISNASTTMIDNNTGDTIKRPADFQDHVAGAHVVGRY